MLYMLTLVVYVYHIYIYIYYRAYGQLSQSFATCQWDPAPGCQWDPATSRKPPGAMR